MCDIQGPKGPGPTGRIGQLKGVALETFQLSDLTPRGRSTRATASNTRPESVCKMTTN